MDSGEFSFTAVAPTDIELSSAGAQADTQDAGVRVCIDRLCECRRKQYGL